MVQLTASIWLLAALSTVALGQGGPGGPPSSCLPGMPHSVCSSLGIPIGSSTTTTPSHTSTANAGSTTDTGSQTTNAATSTGSAGGNGGGEGSTASSAAGPLMTQAQTASGSGMSSGEKIGVGVGVGVGVAAIAAIAAVFLIVRRRRRNTYDANSRTARAMAGGNAPTFVGGAAVGRSQSRSPSVYTPPDTPSNYSRQSNYEAQEPMDATDIAATQRSRTPPRLSIAAPSTPEQESLMPEQKAYFEEGARPSPLEADRRAVSPVSPASVSEYSRPPSPLRDHEKM